MLHQEKKKLEKQKKIKEEQEYIEELNKQEEEAYKQLKEKEINKKIIKWNIIKKYLLYFTSSWKSTIFKKISWTTSGKFFEN